MSIRIPFKIDLRDYAVWLSGRNPFVAEADARHGTSIALENFIAAQVVNTSGGQTFGATDLVAITKSGQVLLVLDGFDEVADITTRKKMVDEISRAAARLQTHQKTIQIIVTSRPAAFTNSPGFSSGEWLHLELQPMTQPQIQTYSEKWMAARHLVGRERKEFAALLEDRLEQPHMRDLARNPMQLTILLALIRSRGLSLPDKRTALYDSYMGLFFDRESEKSRTVRDHRD